jgi:hypothetical protein
MDATTPPDILEQEERRVRMRVTACRAELYDRDRRSPIAVERRLRELERQRRGLVEGLQHARRVREG